MKNMNTKFSKALLTTIATATLALSMSAEARPVNVGGDLPTNITGLDACSLGVVTGLKKNGDGFLAVRNAPSVKSGMYGKIYNGQQVWMCDSNTSGSWSGVIYTKKDTDCKLDRRGDYKGRCHQGWVSAKFIKVIAD